MPIEGRGPLRPPSASSANHHGSSGGPQLIKEYRSLSRFANSSAALALLQSIGRTVTPLMAKYGWRVPLLSEFLPSNPNLLGINVNRGARISLRLRWDTSKDELIDEEQVTLVMLHELVHNVHGPHDERFYALLDKITEEYYEAKRKGRWEGEGFLSNGRKLGAAPSSRLPSLIPGRPSGGRISAGAQKLGGGPSAGGRIVESVEARRKRAAEAAERRRRDAAACPDSQAEIDKVTRETEKRERGQGVDVIVIDDEDDGQQQAGSTSLPRAGTWANGDVHEDKNEDEDSQEIVFTGKRNAQDGSDRHPSVKIELDDVLKTAPDQPSTSGAPKCPAGVSSGQRKPKAQPSDARASPSEPIVISSSEDEDPRRAPPAKRARPASRAPPSKATRAPAVSERTPSRSTLQTRSAAALSLHSAQLSAPRQWTCQVCTLNNPTTELACQACGIPRPSASIAATPAQSAGQRHNLMQEVGNADTDTPGWTCHRCGYRMKDGAAAFWSCSACGEIKKSSGGGQAGWGAMLGGGGY